MVINKCEILRPNSSCRLDIQRETMLSAYIFYVISINLYYIEFTLRLWFEDKMLFLDGFFDRIPFIRFNRNSFNNLIFEYIVGQNRNSNQPIGQKDMKKSKPELLKRSLSVPTITESLAKSALREVKSIT